MTGSVRVLVIDDDEDDYVMIRDMLRDVGGTSATVDWTPAYEAGLDDIRLAAHDVYLLDYRLGERTGLDLFGELNEQERNAPVILMSGHGNHAVDMTAMRDGFSDYIAKEQIEPSLLERSIRYAMTRKRMEAELRRRSEELETLVHVARILAEPGAFTEHVTVVLEELLKVLQVDSADLRMPDANEAGLRVVAAVGSAPQPLGTFRAYGDSRTGRVFQLGQPIIAHDFEVSHRGGPDRGRRYRSGYEAQSVAWLPVKAVGRTVGVLAVDTAKRSHFAPERVRLLEAIADGIGTFLENASLRETERFHVQALEVLNRAATILAGGGSLEERVTDLLQEVVAVAGDWATLRMPDDNGENMCLVASTRERSLVVDHRGETLSRETLTAKRPLIANDYANHPTANKSAIDRGVRSKADFPVMADGQALGTISVSSQDTNYFTPVRVALLSAIAAGIGPSLERARLEEEGRHRARELSTALEQLQLTQQQLIQSGKLAAIGELVAGVAHEINNPLAAILGYTQLLLREDSSEKHRERLERVLAETERVARIVQNLLSFARQQKPEWKAFCVNEALARVMELRGYELKVNNIELTMDLDAGPQVVIGDLQQLEQVFLNIVNNAERAMTTAHQRGRLEIKTRRVKESVSITFVDDGPGIPADIVNRVFDPFFTTAEPGEGTGLGLSICYGIVHQHRGRIGVESPRQGGCVLVVELPLAEAPPIGCDDGPPSDSGTGR